MLDRGYDRVLHTCGHRQSVCHEVQRNLGLLSVLVHVGDPLEDRLEIWLSDGDELFADERPAATSPGPIVALGPGAGEPKRMWPIQRFVEVGRWLANQGFAIVVVGGPGEEALGEELRRYVGGEVIDLTGKATLRQCAAVLQRCAALLRQRRRADASRRSGRDPGRRDLMPSPFWRCPPPELTDALQSVGCAQQSRPAG